MTANYSGLTVNKWPGTWSPSDSRPIVLDVEIRGSLQSISGTSGDQLTDISGARLNPGMIVFVQSSYTAGGYTRNSSTYYTYSLSTGQSRDSNTGRMPNAESNWSTLSMPAISTLNSATTITDNTASTGTNSGALVILGGAGIAGDLYVGATVSVASTAQSTSTTTGALVVAGGVGIGKDLFVGGNINVSGSINLTGSSNFIDFTATTGTFQKVVITSTETSTSTTTGALVVRGGVGIQKDVWIGGRMYSESVQIADSIIDSTSIMVNTTNAIVVDSYSINEFRSSKYLVQIDDGTGLAANFQLIEILLLVDNAGTVYATEYGTLTSNGGLGEFAADVQGDNILRLYFTPYTASSKTIKVLRTAITV